ncbi:uncharacterized protein [Antedon mediterranea]|uniref:uncharacterized protein n=1 Tax=Antedon mediterranea TaxID=105859 RepID=UPI003AF576A3
MMLEEPPTIKCPAGAAENCIDCNECPPPPRKYNTSVTPVSVAVDDLPFYIKLFASGKYEARVTFSDAIGDVLCIDMSLEVTTSSIKAEEPIVLDTLPDYCKALPPKKDSSVNDLA